MASEKLDRCREYVEALCRRSGEYYARWLANPTTTEPVPLTPEHPND